MKYRQPAEKEVIVHLITENGWATMVSRGGLQPLCEKKDEDMTIDDVVLSIADLHGVVLLDDEHMCPLCLAHEDYPLLLLAHTGE